MERNSNTKKSNEGEERQQRQTNSSVHDLESGLVNESEKLAEENKTKPQLNQPTTSDGIKTKSQSKMTETNHSNQLSAIEPDSRGRSKVVFNVSRSASQERKRRSSSKQEDDISHFISQVVERACEGSVASDVSGLTDGEFFKTDDFSIPSATFSSKNKTLRSMARAPEPPSVSHGTSKLTDIQSETTATASTRSISSLGDKPAKNKKKRSVSFCEVKVRNYERILEFNPSVTSGPAVGIGWNYSPEDQIFSLENFEESREFSRCNSVDELALPRDKREDLLRNWGFTQREIAFSVRSILRSKNQRKQTVQNLHAASMEEFMEKATRKMKNVLLLPLHTRKKVKQPYAYPPQIYSPSKNFESSVLRKTSLAA